MGCGGSKDAKPHHAKSSNTVDRREFEEEIPTGPDLRPDARYVWYWEEDKDRVATHHTWDKQGTFVAYPPRVSEHIESEYATWSADKSAGTSYLEITYKVFAEGSGFNYRVDFTTMRQINGTTGYQRKLLRRDNPNYVSNGDSLESESSQTKVPPPALLYTKLQTMKLEQFCEIIDKEPMDLDAESTGGGTLLTWAAESHRADIVLALLERHVDVNKPDSSSHQTALQWATNTASTARQDSEDTSAAVDREATIARLVAAGAHSVPAAGTEG